MDTITLIPVERKAEESAYSKDDEDYEKPEYPWRACMALTRHGLFIHDVRNWPQNEVNVGLQTRYENNYCIYENLPNRIITKRAGGASGIFLARLGVMLSTNAPPVVVPSSGNNIIISSLQVRPYIFRCFCTAYALLSAETQSWSALKMWAKNLATSLRITR